MSRTVILASLLLTGTALAQTQTGVASPTTSLPSVNPAAGTVQGQGQPRNGGISHVTRVTPMVESTVLARGFFTAAGVNLGAPQLNAQASEAAITSIPTAAAIPSNSKAGHPGPRPEAISRAQWLALTQAARRGDLAAQALLSAVAETQTNQPPRVPSTPGR